MEEHHDLTDEYQGIFMTIELEVVNTYRNNPELVDHNVDKVYEGLHRTFEKELQGKNPPRLRLNDLEEALHDRLTGLCEIFLGDGELKNEDGEDIDLPMEPISKEVIVKILKRLRSSIKTWSSYGRRGYLEYISRFM
jgi:hypothetical protein